MQIAIEKAKEKLNLLEQLETNPEILLTKLFTGNVSDVNILLNIQVNGKYFEDYINHDIIPKISVLSNTDTYKTSITYRGMGKVFVKSLYEDEPYISVLEFNANEKTFKFDNKIIEQYDKEINKIYEFHESALDNFWKDCIDLSFKSRFKKACKALTAKKKDVLDAVGCFLNFCFWIFMSKKEKREITSKLNRVQKDLADTNAYFKQKYEQNIERQKICKENIEKYKEMVENKRKEVSDYLVKLGYQKETEDTYAENKEE